MNQAMAERAGTGTEAAKAPVRPDWTDPVIQQAIQIIYDALIALKRRGSATIMEPSIWDRESPV